ncbi:major Facilitator Superfamily protein [Mycobacteroides abscessus MAB_110811_1470]|nr:major Facilitator Superfamily protein [Mycobacteroides abscessus MAB_110811_1470]
MRYWVIAHAVDDFYQGLVPAAIPFFVLERHYSYAAASGLALAATLGSALPQPLLGLIADRWRLLWMAPAGDTRAGVRGLGATAWFIPPAVIMGFVLWRYQVRQGSANSVDRQLTGNDRWGAFSILVAVEVVRSAVYFGMNTFIALYLIDHLDVSAAVGGVGLAMFLGGGVIGTLLGGRISDRLGMIATIRVGSIVAIPAFVALRTCPQPWIALALAAVVGITVNIPFAVLVKLGQDYLPTRPGTAAGVTLGLAVSIGGFFVPLLGVLADHHGPQAVLTTLCVVPILAIVLAFLLPRPERE